MASSSHYHDGISSPSQNSVMDFGNASDGDFFELQRPLQGLIVFEKSIKVYSYDDIPVRINLSTFVYVLVAIGFSIIPAFLDEGEGMYSIITFSEYFLSVLIKSVILIETIDIVSWIIFASTVLVFQLFAVFLSVRYVFHCISFQPNVKFTFYITPHFSACMSGW